MGVVRQSHVHGTALVGRHRLQGYRVSGAGDPLGDSLSEVGQGLVAPLLIAFDIDHQVGPSAQLPADDEPYQELEGPESLAAPADEKARVVAFDLEHRASEILVLSLSQGGDHVDSQLGYQIVEDLVGNPDDVRGLFEARDPHLGGLAAKAENTCLAPANDVYFYFASFGVELP